MGVFGRTQCLTESAPAIHEFRRPNPTHFTMFLGSADYQESTVKHSTRFLSARLANLLFDSSYWLMKTENKTKGTTLESCHQAPSVTVTFFQLNLLFCCHPLLERRGVLKKTY